jgi:hypothetical protein
VSGGPAFPSGVTDPRGTTGYVSLADDAIVAVDLTSGQVRWRAPAAGRPLLMTGAGLLVVRRTGQRVDLVVLDPTSGKVVRDLGPLPVPDWVAVEWDHTDGFVAFARPRDNDAEVVWRANRRYRGGAAPPARLVPARSGDGETGGVVRVDLVGGRLETLVDAEPGLLDDEVPDQARTAVESGDRVYSLEAAPAPDGSTSVVLTASRVGHDAPLWEAVLDRRTSQRPPPPRP